MKRSLIISFIMLFSLPTSAIATCTLPVCVDVYTQDNQIIIEAQKPGTSQVKKPPRPKPSPTATLWFPPKPSPTPHPYVKRTYKPRIVKPKTVTQTANLSDRLTKLVPTGGIAFQPAFEPLVQVPVIFWVDVPQVFQSRVNIIGEIVDVGLRPGFIWSFGDGSVWATTNIGAPFPHQVITHTYKKPGTYAVVLLTTWNGTFTHNGAERAITGQIVNTSVATVTVVSAPTRFTK